ncbi:heparinase II/III-family protein [Marinobacterium sp. LSUCC0821]|uniref:heparinase II/III family protein n=1 Tax=Marinobacterium sp. LSUCC0821 TaxID=2668067 RepID=UPI001451FA45|nr:heparinase II/III-family protein [Marinobacterium sp. LSUCC0821]QJD72182.1 heparinase [Marinobacterium sp. LSUCC0821]
MSFLVKARTAAALGALNLCRAISYRLGVKLGFNPVRRLTGNAAEGVFFNPQTWPITNVIAPSHWESIALLFGHYPIPVTTIPPDWHANPITGKRVPQPEKDWWSIPDFDPALGDIKLIWELSRFDWVLAFSQQARAGNYEAFQRLNNWLNDWCTQNPPYKGPNWKCGQEASIRVLHLAMAALILEQIETAPKALVDIVELHLQRIAPTLRYAMAQDNNHGTSEAAALFIGGSWLTVMGSSGGAELTTTGRRWLENRASHLIGEDGSFSQYSLNYHRVMLDTFSMVEVWRRKLALPEFSACWQQRARAAANWLYAMTNHWNGDGPNLGANDGARLLPLTDTDYRDFRPSVQLATVLFLEANAYSEDGVWNQPLNWLGLERPDKALPAGKSEVFDQGGYVLLCMGDAKVMLRYPKFRFRPSQADALHLDFWLQECNLLRDAGTFSYNTEARWLQYFSGTESHNTVQFDGRDQMPRLSRFLFGDWLKTNVFKPIAGSAYRQAVTAGYKDGKNAQHVRSVSLCEGLLSVTDEIAGFKEKAVLRWRLEPGDWKISGDVISKGTHSIKVMADIPIKRYELVEGWESRFYQDKQPVPVLEVELHQPGILTTEYRWVS